MSDINQLKQAQKIYQAFKKALDNDGWAYDEHSDELKIVTGVKGEEMPINIIIDVDAKAELVSVISYINIESSQERRVAMALATAVANAYIASGTFDYDVSDGYLQYKIVNTYHGALLGEELLKQMLYLACAIVEKYNDKFLYVASSNISGRDIIDFMVK